MKPKAIDLYCGLGGWTDGLLAEGYEVTGYDIEAHAYGEHRYPSELILKDVRTLHGSTLKDAALIVASPPCQEYSYMAMPWKLAKAKAAAIRADTTGKKLADLNCLFNECFRIQREASFAAGRHIPLIVENVRGAQPWVGRARFNYGSFYLWGDVPALMPVAKHVKVPTMGAGWYPPDHPKHVRGLGFNTHAERHVKDGRRTDPGKGARFTSRDCGVDARKRPGVIGETRKAASAIIAKIPLPLSRWIASCYYSTHETNTRAHRQEVQSVDGSERITTAQRP